MGRGATAGVLDSGLRRNDGGQRRPRFCYICGVAGYAIPYQIGQFGIIYKGQLTRWTDISSWAGSLDFESDIAYWDTRPPDEYVAWQRDVIARCLELVGDSGAVFYNTKFQPCDLGLDTRHEIADGFPLRQIIIWDKRSAINTGGRAPTILPPSYEVVLLFAGRHWEIPKTARADARKWRDVWHIAPSTAADTGHTASFPIELARRCIKLGGGAVLDPFAGSGTTGLAAMELGFPYILIDREPEYEAVFKRRWGSPANPLSSPPHPPTR